MESELGDCGEITIKGVIVGGIHGIMALFMRKGGRSLLVDISLRCSQGVCRFIQKGQTSTHTIARTQSLIVLLFSMLQGRNVANLCIDSDVSR